KHFKFNGMPVEEDLLTPVDPTYRLSGFDTTIQGWGDEEREELEQRLADASVSGDYIIIETPKRPAPWPGYDKLKSAAKIADLTQATGSDVEGVLAYERENLNRPEVIEAVQALVPEEEDEVVVQA